MRKTLLLLASFLFIMSMGTLQAQTRGLNVIPIKDASGNQVGLYKGSYALVLAVSDYTAGWPKLPSVVGETENIQAALESNGFHVRRVLNPDEDELKSAFDRFIDQYGYERDNRLLIFFSGHGYSRKKGAKGYLVPVDAPDPRRDEKGFLRKALPMNQVIAWCRQMEAKHALLLFDSCFSGTIFKTKALSGTPSHITAITSRPVRQFIAAGDAGEEVPAKSVFATCFIRALQGEADYTGDGYVTGTELGMYLSERLLYYRTGQTPQYGKIRDPELDEGDFVFSLKNSGAARPANISHAQPVRSPRPWIVNTFWNIDSGGSLEFLPDGELIFVVGDGGKWTGSWTLDGSTLTMTAKDWANKRADMTGEVAGNRQAIKVDWQVVGSEASGYFYARPK